MTGQVDTPTEDKGETSVSESSKGAVQRNPGDMGAEVIDEPREDVKDFGGLFGDEKAFTEEELLGEVVEEKPADKIASEEKKPDGEDKKPAEPPKPTGDEKKEAEAEKKEDALQKKEDKAKDTEEGKIPPKGFVPQEALREARDELKTLKAELAEVRAELTAKPLAEIKPPESSEDTKWKDFKVLTDEEYEELIDEEGPVEAQKYDRKLRQFEKYQEQKQQADREASKRVEQVKNWVSETVRDIEKAVPGIYDQGSDIQTKLAEFAMERGGWTNEHYLEALTNPETLIIPKGADKPYLIGPGAVGLVTMLHNFYKTTSEGAVNPDELRKEITKELEPKLREEITKQLLSKMKGTDKESAYRSLTETPGAEGMPDEFNRNYTEEEWAKLPADKREQLLQGP